MVQKELGELGQEIMEIIWNDKTATLKGVTFRLRKKRKIAYTTVATILQRLLERGILKREYKEGHSVYTPQFSKQVYLSQLVKGFINKALINYGDLAISSFVEGLDSLPKTKKSYLLKLLNETKNKQT